MGGGYFLFLLVGKETASGGEISRCMFILSMIHTSEEDVVVQEPLGFGGGTAPAILLLYLWKRWVLMVASYLRSELSFRAVYEWVWWS